MHSFITNYFTLLNSIDHDVFMTVGSVPHITEHTDRCPKSLTNYQKYKQCISVQVLEDNCKGVLDSAGSYCCEICGAECRHNTTYVIKKTFESF